MNIEEFMLFKIAGSSAILAKFAALFHTDGEYHNTPFQFSAAPRNSSSTGSACNPKKTERSPLMVRPQPQHRALRTGAPPIRSPRKVVQVWAKSQARTSSPRKPGDPLPRMVLDGVLKPMFAAGLCSEAHI